MRTSWLGRCVAIVGVAMTASLAGAGAALGAAGGLDPSFGGDGEVITPFQDGKDVARATAIDAKGRIVVVGEDGSPARERFAIARYLPGGQLDPSFGGDGLVTTDFANPPGEYGATGVAIQPDGRIVVVGHGGNPGDFAVARYLPSGALDSSFSGDGRVTRDFNGQKDVARDVVIQSSGRIVVVGHSGATTALVAYTRSGTQDASFDAGFPGLIEGAFTYDITLGRDYGLAITRDGSNRLLIAAQATDGSNTNDYDFVVGRLRAADGSGDPSFNNIGVATVSFFPGNESADEVAHDLVVLPNGRILVAGEVESSFNFAHFGLLRLTPAGTPDANFGGGDGKVITTFDTAPSSAREVAADSRGRIVLAGDRNKDQFAVARYRSDGALDNSFSGDGRAISDIGAYDVGRGMALQHDGRPVVVGGGSPGGNLDFAVLRYLAGGDPTCAGRIASIVARGRRVAGSRAADVIAGKAGKQVVKAGGGGDRVCGKGGRDVLRGGAGKDRLIGGKGRDRLIGGAGRDLLRGGPGGDLLRGGPKRDRCVGGPGPDSQSAC